MMHGVGSSVPCAEQGVRVGTKQQLSGTRYQGWGTRDAGKALDLEPLLAACVPAWVHGQKSTTKALTPDDIHRIWEGFSCWACCISTSSSQAHALCLM